MIPSLWYPLQKVALLAPRALAAGDDTGNATGTGDDTGNGVTKITLFNPLGDRTLEDMAQYVLNGLTVIAIPIVTIMIVIGAYYIITSGGNPGRRTKGKDYILWAVIGFAVLLLADSVVAIIQSYLGS